MNTVLGEFINTIIKDIQKNPSPRSLILDTLIKQKDTIDSGIIHKESNEKLKELDNIRSQGVGEHSEPGYTYTIMEYISEYSKPGCLELIIKDRKEFITKILSQTTD